MGRAFWVHTLSRALVGVISIERLFVCLFVVSLALSTYY
jgi:hypothetical protein